MQLRRSVSLQAIPASDSRDEGPAPEVLQYLASKLNLLNHHAARMRFQPSTVRQKIRNEIKSEVRNAQSEAFDLDKSLETFLYAMYKTRNDAKKGADQRKDEEIFRQAVREAIRRGKLYERLEPFDVLRRKYKSQDGMGDTAATLKARAGVLAFPVKSAIHRLSPAIFARKEKSPANVDSIQTQRTKTDRAEQANAESSNTAAIHALFASSQDSVSTSHDQGASNTAMAEPNVKISCADIFMRIAKLVEDDGAAVALAAMDETDAEYISAFNGSIRQLREMMQS